MSAWTRSRACDGWGALWSGALHGGVACRQGLHVGFRPMAGGVETTAVREFVSLENRAPRCLRREQRSIRHQISSWISHEASE
jgi:hypothetical protein